MISGDVESLDYVKIVWKSNTSELQPLSPPLHIYYIPFNGIRTSEDSKSFHNHSKHHAHHHTSLTDLKVKVDGIQSNFSGGVTIVASIGSSYHSRMKFRLLRCVILIRYHVNDNTIYTSLCCD